MVERKMHELRGGEEKRVELIKSLIMQDRKDGLEAQLQKIKLNLSADILMKIHKKTFFEYLLN